VLGKSRVLDQKLFCISQAKQRGTTVDLKYFAKQKESRILIASDTNTYRIVPFLEGVKTYTHLLIKNTPGIVKLSIKSGYMVDYTFCILNGSTQSQMMSQGNG